MTVLLGAVLSAWLLAVTAQSDEFQRYDGWFNNPNGPFGTAKSGLIFTAPAAYDDLVSSPAGRNRPSSGLISAKIFHTANHSSPSTLTALFAFFGQAVADEIMSTASSGEVACPIEVRRLHIGDFGSCERDNFTQRVTCDAKNIRVAPFFRAQFDPQTGWHMNNPRRPINHVTSWIDASFVYGVSTPWVESLRSFEGGRLKQVGSFPALNVDDLPLLNPPVPMDFPRLLSPERLYLVGNFNSNQNPALLALSVLMQRYHNVLADNLAKNNPTWNDEQIFQRARRFLIATWQNIIMYEYVPLLLSESGLAVIPRYIGYKPGVDPTISVEFAAAAFRFGQSLIPEGFYARQLGCNVTTIALCEVWWDSSEVLTQYGMEALLRGLITQAQKKGDHTFSSSVKDHLFGGMRMTVSDLPAMTIERGRDFGVADFNTVRQSFGLPRIANWSDINPQLQQENPQLFDDLRLLYDDIDDIDLFVGGMIESSGGLPGPTFFNIILDQFKRIRDGDRFWFENQLNGLFTEQEIVALKSTTLSTVIRAVTSANGEANDPLLNQTNVFRFSPESLCVNQSSFIERGVAPICPAPESYDFWTGSAISFTTSFAVLATVPIVCIFIIWLLAFCRAKSMTKISRVPTLRRQATRRLNESFEAWEYQGWRSGKQRIQVVVKDTLILVYDRTARLVRTIDFNNSELLEVDLRYSEPNRYKDWLLLLRIPIEYDLVLLFDNVEQRMHFEIAIEAAAFRAEKTRKARGCAYELLMKEANTKDRRQDLLTTFFHTAFEMVIRAKDKSRNRNLIGSRHLGFVTPTPKNRKMNKSKSAGNMPNQSEISELDLASLRAASFRLRPEGSPFERVYQLCLKEGKRRHIYDVQLTKGEFARALQLTEDSTFVAQIFRVTDKDNNGYISYPEFIDMLVLMSKGDTESKHRLLFDLYDIDGNGELDRREFYTMIKSMIEVGNKNVKEDQIDKVVDGMLRECGIVDKSTVNFEDFCTIMMVNQETLCMDYKPKVPASESFGKRPHRPLSPHELSVNFLESRSEQTWRQRKTNKFIAWLENHRMHVAIVAIYFMITLYLFCEMFITYVFYKEETGYRKVVGVWAGVSRGSAQAMSFSLSLLLLSVCRNLLTFIRETPLGYYLPGDASIEFHVLCASTTVFFIILHTIGHAINFYQIGTQPPMVINCMFPAFQFDSDFMPKFHFWLFQTVPGLTGVALLILMTVMVTFALPYARQHIHRHFRLTHTYLMPVIYALIIAHGSYRLLQPPFFWKWVIGPALLLTVDYIVSLRRHQLPLIIVDFKGLPSDVLRLSFKCPTSVRFFSGQWARLSCSILGEGERHPFTITSAPHENRIDFYIRGVGPWTRKLNKHMRMVEAERSQAPESTWFTAIPTFYLEGPFGSTHQDWYKFEVVVLVGGGIGVTPTASVLKDVVHKVYNKSGNIACKHVYFIWLARNHQQFEWFIDILREVEQMDSDNLITMDIFVTQLLKDFDIRTMMLFICEQQFHRVASRSVFTGLRARTHFGRINFNAYLSAVRDRHPQTHKVGLFSCGPRAMVRSADQACAQLNCAGYGPQFVAHQEIF